MKRNWATLSQLSNNLYTVQDFERAAYRLATEQVLYASDRGTRVAYRIVEEHLDDFAAALAPLGIRIERNSHYRYVVALPAHAEGSPVTLDETLLVLLLRQQYDRGIRAGQVEESGEVLVELPVLQEAFRALADRAMPDIGQLRALERTLRRWGICRLLEPEPDDPQPFHLLVRPAIVEIVGAQWLQRLDQHNSDDESGNPGDPGNDDDHASGGNDDAAA